MKQEAQVPLDNMAVADAFFSLNCTKHKLSGRIIGR